MYVYIYIYGQNRYMRVCVHIYKWGCLKKGVPHNIYIHIHTHIYLCVCFQNLKDWYNFDLGECLKHRTQFSCSIYCKDKGDLEETIYFSYIIDIKIQQGLVFLQVARTGEKPWGTIHQKQMPESFNIYKNHIPWKALCSVCFMRPFMYKYMLGKHTHTCMYIYILSTL